MSTHDEIVQQVNPRKKKKKTVYPGYYRIGKVSDIQQNSCTSVASAVSGDQMLIIIIPG